MKTHNLDISQHAKREVSRIARRAKSLGWRNEDLRKLARSVDHWHSPMIGVATVGEVTAQSLEIIAPNGDKLRLYNHRIDHPWLQHTTGGEHDAKRAAK